MLSAEVLFILLPLVTCHDVAIGLNSYGKKIFDEDRQASPAIWRQRENVTIEAPDNEVISKVLVIDMRPEKDGDAKIVDGGEKEKNVTIELKSPTVFRGYDFHIEVYAVPANHISENSSMSVHSPTDITSTEESPEPITSENYVNSENIDASSNNLNHDSKNESIISEYNSTTLSPENTKDINNEQFRSARGLKLLTDNDASNLDSTHKYNETIDEMLTTIYNDVTPKDIEITTSMSDPQNTTLPDFPEIYNMEGDESRHVRKVSEDINTSTINSPTANITINSDIDITPEDSPTITSLSEVNENHTKLVTENETDMTTMSADIASTTLSEEFATMSPNKNGKDIIDFDDLLSTDGEGTRYARQTVNESTTVIDDLTTESEVTSTASPETSENSAATEQIDVSENTDAEESSKLEKNITNDFATNEDINFNNNNMPPILRIIIGNGDNDINSETAKPEVEVNMTEGSGDHMMSTDNENVKTPIFTTGSTENGSPYIDDEQYRNARGLSLPIERETTNLNSDSNGTQNFPVFVDPTVDTSDYVYVPIIVVVSRHNYPVFQDILNTISKNNQQTLVNNVPFENFNPGMSDSNSKPVL